MTRLHGVITFVTVPAAEDYRKTIAMEQEAGQEPPKANVRLSAPTVAASA